MCIISKLTHFPYRQTKFGYVLVIHIGGLCSIVAEEFLFCNMGLNKWVVDFSYLNHSGGSIFCFGFTQSKIQMVTVFIFFASFTFTPLLFKSPLRCVKNFLSHLTSHF